MKQKALQIHNVKKRFGRRTVVDVKEFSIGTYGIEGLIGPNGAGKTTLINLITHKVTMDQGQILFYNGDQEIDVSIKSLDEISRLGLVKTNQVIQDFESLSIKDSFLLSLATSKHEKFYKLFNEKELRRSAEAEIEKYLDYFHFDNTEGHALSAGEKKLLDIIRCMLLKPRFLLMDEPTAGLPQDQTNKVIDLIRKKRDEEGMKILIVEHDLDLIWKVCERVHFMAEGCLLFEGSPEEIKCNQTVIEKYVGSGSDAKSCRY